MHRTASTAWHGLLRTSLATTEAPASAWSSLLAAIRSAEWAADGGTTACRSTLRTLHTLQCQSLLNGNLNAGRGVAFAITAATSLLQTLSRSAISRQFTSLREAAVMSGPGAMRHACWRQPRHGDWRALPLPLQHQLRRFAAGGGSSSDSGGGVSSSIAGAARAAAAAGSRRMAQRASVDQKSSSQALYLTAMIVGMVGVTYSSVPLYRMFCQATGYGGTVAEGKTVEAKIRAREESPDAEVEAAAAAREITVSFNADVNDNMPWKFQPTQRSIKLRPGQSTLAFYTAENTSDRVITGVSTYNVTPQQAGLYFNKIQCFCFEEQKLRPGEKIDMPVFFYVDPEFATDPRMRKVNHLTLSYTFFKVSDQTVEEDAAAEPLGGDSLGAAQDPGGIIVPAAAGV